MGEKGRRDGRYILMRLEINMPRRIMVSDYHELQQSERNYKILSNNIKVKEIGFDGQYLGIVYIGSLQEPENQFINSFSICNNSSCPKNFRHGLDCQRYAHQM